MRRGVKVALGEREHSEEEVITAVIGGALFTGAMLGCGAASADAYYKNCTAAWNAGVAPLHEGDDGYEAPRLDRDERRHRLRNRSPVDPVEKPGAIRVFFVLPRR